MHRGTIVGMALMGALLLASGKAFADHQFVLQTDLVDVERTHENSQGKNRAEDRGQARKEVLPWTTDGRTPVGTERAKELFPIENISGLRDSRK